MHRPLARTRPKPSGTAPLAARAFRGDVRVGPVIHAKALLEEFAVDPGAVLAEAGLPARLFDDPDRRIPFDLLGRLLETCAERTACPHFGLLVGQRSEPSSLGELNNLMQNCRTVRDALLLGTSHLEVNDRGATSLTLDIAGGRTALGYAILGGSTPGYVQILDGALAMQFRLLRSLCGPTWHPLLVRLSRSRPADTRPYRAALGGDVEFDADLSTIVFESRWLDQPIAGADNTSFLAAARAIEVTETADPLPFAQQVRRAVLALLFTGSASTTQIARLFNLAPRTLRRRLAEQGATVRGILNDVRRELALHLLWDTQLKFSEIAAALRYADAAVFSRAFHSWTGMSPRQWHALRLRRPEEPRGVGPSGRARRPVRRSRPPGS